MTIQNQVNKILIETKDKSVKSALRILKAEFQREKTKEISDERAVKIIRGLINSEQERINHIDIFKKGGSIEKAEAIQYVHILNGMLPVMVGEEEITEWITDNVDFSKFKNPMQAIKEVQAHFGVNADNATIREVIQKIVTIKEAV